MAAHYADHVARSRDVCLTDILPTKCDRTSTDCSAGFAFPAAVPDFALRARAGCHVDPARIRLVAVTIDATTESSDLYPVTRLAAVREATAAAGLDALLLTPRPRSALCDRLRRAAAGAAHLPGAARRGRAVPVVPRLELPAAEHSPGAAARHRVRPLGRDRRPLRARRRAAGAGPRPVGAGRPHVGDAGRCAFRDALPGAEQALAGTVLRELRMRKSPGRGRGAARGRRGDRRACTPRCRDFLRAGPHRARGRPRHRRGDPRRRARHGRLRHRRLRPQRRQPAPRAVRPGHPGRASPSSSTSAARCPSGYCSDSTRIYCVGEPPADFAAYYEVLQRAQEAACAAVRPGVTARVGRRGRPRDDRRRRLRRVLHPPHRPRHRPGDARGALHRRGQHRAARAGHGLLRRAGHLPAGPARRPHRGHRRVHRDGGERLNTTDRATS